MQPVLSFAPPFSRVVFSSSLSRSKVWAQEPSSTDFSAQSESFSFKAEGGMHLIESGQAVDQNFLLNLLIMAVIGAAVFTVFTALQVRLSNTLVGTELAEAGPHYKLRLLGKNILIGERCPGWVYFWLLMAAGLGLFVSEEALNVWVGATLARSLTFNGLWMDLITSVSANGSYIFSTLFWVYWGVCISDMIPFYAGRFASQTKAGDTIRKKVGVNEKKLRSILQTVQRYGNLIGFVERFSLGVRNPTSFIAGAMRVAPDKFFTGVCVGALITMPLQMVVGFLLRERPMAGLAVVAAAVGAWTVLPYLAAGMASIVFVIRNRVAHQINQQQHDQRKRTD